MNGILVISAFDDLRAPEIRLLQEAAARGPCTAVLLSDPAIKAITGRAPKFPEAERRYFLQAIRYVSRVVLQPTPQFDRALVGLKPGQSATVIDRERNDSARLRAWASGNGLSLQIISETTLNNLPPPPMCPINPRSTGKKVIVSGSFDWFHSGHVRFFEEASAFGDLYVVVGHDANIRLLKGPGHPMFSSTERTYIANAIRYAKVAVVSSGHGWLDAEPEIQKI
ncbi:MAG: adenylyltransferase/cytidyltransferase family protein, partial [Phycisphaerae bacterium]|nr:adenylyltransferase/cytidyltransferase family protein [Phycisphaerae bacterium]